MAFICKQKNLQLFIRSRAYYLRHLQGRMQGAATAANAAPRNGSD